VSDPVTVDTIHSTHEKEPWALGLRILCHPDLSRIDDIAELFAFGSHGEARLGRHAPEFRRPDGSWAGALASLRVSRKPVLLVQDGTGSVTIHVDGDADHVFVDEQPLRGPLLLSAERVRQGALVRLGKHVLLWLGPVPTTVDPWEHGAPLSGDSQAVRALRGELRSVAELQVSVLLHGEPGVGKESAARALHATGPRSRAPLVAVSAAAVPAHGAYAALYGERGQGSSGYLAEAAGGTLFFDQLAGAPSELQTLLARLLDGDSVQPAAPARDRAAQRIIGAVDDAEDGDGPAALRSGLGRRFSYTLRVPPLRERRPDVPGLFVSLLRAEMEALGEGERLKPTQGDETPAWIPAEFMASLVRRSWPGNLLDVRRAALRFAVFNRGRDRGSVPPDLASEPEPERKSRVPERRTSVSELSDADIELALARNAYVVDATAEDLGVSRSWLHAHLNESPAFRKAKDLSAEEIARSLEAHAGDITAAALALRVSRRGLQLQMSRFGIRPGGQP
jgi:two-component system, NtrC family, nitrogen regulation response regulator GlnG